MARYDGRLARLEKLAKAASKENRQGQALVTLPLTESLERAIAAAEAEAGKPLAEIDPWTLSGTVWADLADAIVECGLGIFRQC